MENIIIKAAKEQQGKGKSHKELPLQGHGVGQWQREEQQWGLLGFRLVLICHGILPLPSHPCALPVLL